MDFKSATHTFVISDFHLCEAEPAHPFNPLWKRFKRREYFVDEQFRAFVEYIKTNVGHSIELVFNGDTFDFDSVLQFSKDEKEQASWLELKRGFTAEAHKSGKKFERILNDHPVFIQTLREFILLGHRVIFVIGNHDVELHWPGVRKMLSDTLNLPLSHRDQLRFCEWFYISNSDTLIEHGNQYDAYSVCINPIHPLIKKGRKILVRLPFGNLANKYILNGMGLFNPHSEASFIKNGFLDYVDFYYRKIMRTQPLLMWTWFWGAMITLITAVSEGLLPAVRDPLTSDARIQDIAKRANTTPASVWALRELHVHSAIFNPIKLLRELWLDRALFIVLIVFGSFQFFSFLNVFMNASVWWFIIPVLILTPVFLFYAKSVESEVIKSQAAARDAVAVASQLTGTHCVVMGHTHLEAFEVIAGTTSINTGSWSNAFKDVECTLPYGKKCFAWIRPKNADVPIDSPTPSKRESHLFEWTLAGPVLLSGSEVPSAQSSGDIVNQSA